MTQFWTTVVSLNGERINDTDEIMCNSMDDAASRAAISVCQKSGDKADVVVVTQQGSVKRYACETFYSDLFSSEVQVIMRVQP